LTNKIYLFCSLKSRGNIIEHFVGTKTLFVLKRCDIANASIILLQNYKPNRALRAGLGFMSKWRNVSGRIRAQNAELY